MSRDFDIDCSIATAGERLAHFKALAKSHRSRALVPDITGERWWPESTRNGLDARFHAILTAHIRFAELQLAAAAEQAAAASQDRSPE